MGVFKFEWMKLGKLDAKNGYIEVIIKYDLT